MLFKSDTIKQAIEVCFFHRHDKNYPPLIFISTNVQSAAKSISVIKTISLIKTTILRPNNDYADKIYDQPLNEFFKRKTEMC